MGAGTITQLLNSGGSQSEGHNPPRGSPRKFASQGALRGSFRGLCRGLSEGSAGSPRVLWGSGDFPRFFGGGDPMLVTLGNCWITQLLNSPYNYSEKPHVRNFLACNSGAGNGYANFICARDFLGGSLCLKTPMRP